MNNLLDNILSLNILEINNLVLDIEKTLNISDDIRKINIKTNEQKETEEDKPVIKFIVNLKSIKLEKKISVLKTLKSILNTGLKETKDILENLPYKVKETLEKKEAEDTKSKLEESGAVIELKKL